jgi:hypothetical protein
MTRKDMKKMVTCRKEKEISEMHKNTQETKEKIIGIERDIQYIRKSLEGNGQKGLMMLVDEHDAICTIMKGEGGKTGLLGQIADNSKFRQNVIGGGKLLGLIALALGITSGVLFML